MCIRDSVGSEMCIRDRAIGNVTSAEFGWSVGAPLAYAWLPVGIAEGDAVAVSCAGVEFPATVVSDVQFDPAGTRLRS
jgi:glycine cleavage system aminomethyltransferase T